VDGQVRAAAKPTADRRAGRPDRVRSQVYVEGLQLPSALSFAPDGRLFLVEVNAGKVRVVRGGVLEAQPVATFPVQQAAESGLLGLALDPDFGNNHHVYVYYAEAEPGRPEHAIRNRVVRFVERDGRAGDLTPIVDNLPANPVGAVDAHQGGALIFGPDGKLYITVGDTGVPDLAQDPAALEGKVLRVNPDGSIPTDNPFPGSPVYALGFRNPWGLAVHPRTGGIFVSENGNKAHDKIMLLQAGGNYGWPLVEQNGDDPRFVQPIWDSGDGADARNGMTGLIVYDGDLFSEYRDSLFFCAFRTGKLRRLVLGGADANQVDSQQRLEAECRLGLTVGPDEAIYTSSIDKVYRITK
jgi:glucose/arabinose dehydrogenase